MNRTVASLLLFCISFIAGLLVAVGAYRFVQTRLFPPATLEVLGVLQFQAQPADLSASGNPPNGYYVESTAVDRFYLEGEQLESYVGAPIFATGTIATVCGPDTFPCYPKLLVQSVTQTPGPG